MKRTMKMNVGRVGILRVFLLIFLLQWLCVAEAGELSERFVTRGRLSRDNVAVKIVDLSDGRVVESYNTAASLIPASILKTVSIASLISEKGSDWTWDTPVYIDGPVDNGVLRGNIIVVGSGDPSLNSRPEPCGTDFIAEIVKALEKEGVREVEGRIIVNTDLFPGPACPPSWASADLPHSYGTGCHALNFENNCSGQRSVASPETVFENKLRAAMSAAGISHVGGSVKGGRRRLLHMHHSPAADEVMRSCMMRSDNLFAESILRTYAVACGCEGATTEGARLETEKWNGAGLPMEGVTIVDGSGLSRSNRVTADFVADVLAKMADDPTYVSFFPLAGQEGTLKKFLKDTPLDSYVALKTGSMNGIQCYAGYKLDDDYAPTHVVVVIANSMSDRASMRKALEEMLLDVFPER